MLCEMEMWLSLKFNLTLLPCSAKLELQLRKPKNLLAPMSIGDKRIIIRKERLSLADISLLIIEKLMLYELFYLVGVSKEAELPKIKPEIQKIVTVEGGVFEEKEVVEKRKLAYKVGRETHGFYVAHRFNLGETERLGAINKKLGLYPGILRFIISRTEDLPELTTREERKEKEAAKIKFIPRKKEVEAPATKTETKKEKTVLTEAADIEKLSPKKETRKTEVSQEDIDKKLEEILNI